MQLLGRIQAGEEGVKSTSIALASARTEGEGAEKGAKGLKEAAAEAAALAEEVGGQLNVSRWQDFWALLLSSLA